MYQKKRPTVALCMIVKNERHNLPRLLESVRGCFDEIHITDTGSTDGTLQFLEQQQERKGDGTPIHLHHFTWIEDFAAARNFSFSHAQSEFVMWLDGDDVLGNAEAFKLWRDTAMELADYWLVPYHYAYAGDRPICSFARERVVRRSRGFQWRYFIHEGIDLKGCVGQPTVQQCATWTVNHKRTAEDLEKDRSRNIRIFEKHAASGTPLDPRMNYYWGKELFESGQHLEAFHKLATAATTELEHHDRILCLQYAASAAQMCNQYDKAANIALQGLHLAPLRPEFHVLIADSFVKVGRLAEAIPFYHAAKHCAFAAQAGATPIFSNPEASEGYPTLQLARIWAQLGDFKKAQEYGAEAAAKWGGQEAHAVLAQIEDVLKVQDLALVKPGSVADQALEQTDEITISCPAVGAYPWDEDVYAQKGIGGSETAAVEMSRHLAKLTGRKVIIFNNTQQVRRFPSGVEYRPADSAPAYFSRYKPAVNIMWRHTTRMTPAPSFVWCHDLQTPGLENLEAYDQAICLSDFAKRYVMSNQGIPSEKIHVSRNGINPDRFRGWKLEKNPNKVVFPSSPDRGLDRAIRIVEKARGRLPELELHVYYGLDNLEKYGLTDLATKLKAMIAERPWVKYHGNVQQDVLAKEMATAAVWLYPANFIETFCITAIESLASGVFPLVREMGALQNTLREAHLSGMALLVDMNAETELEQEQWADALVGVISEKRWENVTIDAEAYSWESVAKEWCKWLNLSTQ